MEFVPRQCSSIWEAQCAHRGDIPSEGFISSYSSPLQMPSALCYFLASFLLTFKCALSLCRRDRQSRTCTPRLSSGRVPGDGTEFPPPSQKTLTEPSQWSHVALPSQFLSQPTCLPRSYSWLMLNQQTWVTDQPPMLFMNVPCTQISDTPPREISSQLANKFCSIPAYNRT